MTFARALAALILFGLLAACNPRTDSAPILLMDGERTLTLPGDVRLPGRLLDRAGIALGPADVLLANGQPVPPDQPLTCAPCTLQIRRAERVTLTTPEGEQSLTTAAFTVGEALEQAGLFPGIADRIEPPPATPIRAGMTITYVPARTLTVRAGEATVTIRSAARTVGEALAQAGLAPQGMDYSLPAEDAPLPADGQIRLVRVREELLLAQKSLPFSTEFVPTAEFELDQQGLLQAGEPGLALTRTRIRYEDGVETQRRTEAESVIRPAQNRITGYGTRVVVRTTVVDGVTIEYWRAVRVYATSYSPCRSAGEPGRCYPRTANLTPVQKGVIAVVSRWFEYMVDLPVYVPGYGYATVQDIGGGFNDRYWIDLAYSDADFVSWGEWTTLYFLTPVPSSIMYLLPYR